MSDPAAGQRDAVLSSADLLDQLADLAARAEDVRSGWADLSPVGRREALRAVVVAAEHIALLTDRADPAVVAQDAEPVVVHDPVTATRDEPAGEAPLGEEVFDRVLGIVAAVGGIDEVLEYLIEEVRPHRAPIDEAIAAFRLDRTRGPYAERAVQLLEAALRTGLFQ
jgi:hypothetical protein